MLYNTSGKILTQQKFGKGNVIIMGSKPSKTFGTIREQYFAATGRLRVDYIFKNGRKNVTHEEEAQLR